ncbi:MAG: DUF2130 domain-containing protein [Campylobacteraceae bacterium]
MQDSSIKCPNCGTLINVNEMLYTKLEDEAKKKLNAEIAEHRKKYKEAMDEFKTKQDALKEQEEKFTERVSEAIKKELKDEKQKIELALKKQFAEEQSEQFKALQKELDEKSKEVKELNLAKIEIQKLKREKEESETKIKLEAELEFSKKIAEEKEKIKKQSDEANELKLKQKDEHLEQLKRQLNEAQRKAEQGSMQLQGETQELAIEEYLRAEFPFDVIEEIKKGQRGADCIQNINTRELQNCGKIYYESKRTKDFQNSWIEKFKADMREKGADIGVLVTNVLPSALKRMGLYEGIWVCTFEEFKALCFVLRESIINLANATKSNENKSDKMSLLYNYLTSNEFRMQIEAIVEGFTQMQIDLDSEKRAMGRIWKQREKQIIKVLENTTSMYDSIKGVAGNAIANIKTLELPYQDEDENDE